MHIEIYIIGFIKLENKISHNATMNLTFQYPCIQIPSGIYTFF